MEKRLASALPVRRKKKPEGKLKVTARTPKAAFLRAVEKTKEYIASGDVFQCVLSQRFDCVPAVDAFEIYRALRIVNPSPYMYFLRFGLDGEGAKAALVDMAAAVIVLVVAADVGGEQPHHVVAQRVVGLRPHHQVKVVGHQTIPMHLPIGLCTSLPQRFQKQ